MPDAALLQALDDLLLVYDFLLRGERAEGDLLRLESILGTRIRPMSQQEREDLFVAFTERAREEGWADEGIGEFLEWIHDELGI